MRKSEKPDDNRISSDQIVLPEKIVFITFLFIPSNLLSKRFTQFFSINISNLKVE